MIKKGTLLLKNASCIVSCEEKDTVYKVKQSTTSIKRAWAWVNATDFLYVLVPKKDFVR
ncbi:hypothetical protein M2145_000896 [Lachnospiraceae bacterium PF1-21]|uniref:hypothetical protein n=1 Tax=Ohessyouella blattaphilus TaxID=2949333 RepID=UPI003E242FFE